MLSAFPKSTMIAWEMTERHTVEVSCVRSYLVHVECGLGIARRPFHLPA